MLEKLAEIIRGEVREAGLSVEVPCIACDKRHYGSDACSADNFCPNVATPDGSLMLARWAVLLVAKGLPSLGASKKAMEAYENAVTEFNDARRSNKPLDAFQDKEDATWREWRELEYIVIGELDDLIAEAKEGTHDAV